MPRSEMARSDISFATLRNNPYLAHEHVEVVASAAVVFVPKTMELDEATPTPYFPEDTETLFQFFKRAEKPDMRVEIALDDERYAELARHSAEVVLPTILVSAVGLPLVINLFTEWIAHRLWSSTDDTRVTAEVILDHRNEATVMRYAGPPAAFIDALRVLQQRHGADDE